MASTTVYTEYLQMGDFARNITCEHWKFMCFGNGEANREEYLLTNTAMFKVHTYGQLSRKYEELYKRCSPLTKFQKDVKRKVMNLALQYTLDYLCPNGVRKNGYQHLKCIGAFCELITKGESLGGYRFTFTFTESYPGMPCLFDFQNCSLCPPFEEDLEDSDWENDFVDEHDDNSEPEPCVVGPQVKSSDDNNAGKILFTDTDGKKNINTTRIVTFAEPVIGSSGDVGPSSQVPPPRPPRIGRPIPRFFGGIKRQSSVHGPMAEDPNATPEPPPQTPLYKKAKQEARFPVPSLIQCSECGKYCHQKLDDAGNEVEVPCSHYCVKLTQSK